VPLPMENITHHFHPDEFNCKKFSHSILYSSVLTAVSEVGGSGSDTKDLLSTDYQKKIYEGI
jgi:hypothetical protein